MHLCGLLIQYIRLQVTDGRDIAVPLDTTFTSSVHLRETTNTARCLLFMVRQCFCELTKAAFIFNYACKAEIVASPVPVGRFLERVKLFRASQQALRTSATDKATEEVPQPSSGFLVTKVFLATRLPTEMLKQPTKQTLHHVQSHLIR